MERRTFLKGAAGAGLFASMPSIINAAETKRVFKVAIIGCGGRGCGGRGATGGAARDIRNAAKMAGCEIKFTAAADFFMDKAKAFASKWQIDEKYCFDGATGYKKIFELDPAHKPDIVLLTTPLNFRAVHLDAAVKAGVHVFAEKGVSVDPATTRLFLAASREAAAKKLTIVAGTQRRHQRSYILQAMGLKRGVIKPVLGGVISWNSAVPWVRRREAGMSNKAYMCNNWLNFTELSGDHICEQHVHNIDVANWFIGRLPRTALSFGARVRRTTGNQYDFFSTDFDYGDGVHIHSMCRQIGGCYSNVGESFRTVDGSMKGGTGRFTADGKTVSLQDLASDGIDGVLSGNPYEIEHFNLLRSVMGTGPYYNEGETVALSTACAVMARISAYTGQIVRLSDILENKDSKFYNMNCGPSPYDFEKEGDIEMPAYADDKCYLPPA